MSLIPNESYSFPDLEEGAKPEQEAPSRPEEEPVPNLENPPDVIREEALDPAIDNIEESPVVPMAEQPMNPFPMIPVQPVEQTRPPARALKPMPVRPVEPIIPVVPDQLGGIAQPAFRDNEPEVRPTKTMEETHAEPKASEWQAQPHFPPRRRRAKLIRFIVYEALAIGALLVFAKLEVNEQFHGNSLTYLYGAAVFCSALAAAVIPVIFYALPPTLPPGRQ